MYKNFKLTDEERKQILEQHSAHGYKQPINEQSATSNQRLAMAKGYGPINPAYADILFAAGFLSPMMPNKSQLNDVQKQQVVNLSQNVSKLGQYTPEQIAQSVLSQPVVTQPPTPTQTPAPTVTPTPQNLNVNCASSLDEIKQGGLKILKRGCQTDAVKKLQEMLGMPANHQTGFFGSITKGKVLEFQAANKDAEGNPLKQDGIVGDKTYNALVSAKTPEPTATPAPTATPTA